MAAMTLFHTEKCSHLVSEYAMSTWWLCNSIH